MKDEVRLQDDPINVLDEVVHGLPIPLQSIGVAALDVSGDLPNIFDNDKSFSDDALELPGNRLVLVQIAQTLLECVLDIGPTTGAGALLFYDSDMSATDRTS